MKLIKKLIQPFIISVLLILLFFKGCNKEEGETQTITIPDKKGSFPEVKNPEPNKPPQTEYRYKYLTDTDTLEIKVENPINEELIQFYLAHKNKDSLYADAIEEREYTIPYEDSLIKTNNYIKSQGKVLSFKQDYTIKEQKVKVTPKKTVFRLLGGFEIGNTKEFNDFSAKGNLKFQNKQGNILSVGYDTEQRIWVGYDFSIWNVKR